VASDVVEVASDGVEVASDVVEVAPDGSMIRDLISISGIPDDFLNFS
jgi:hypothetical protein